MKKFISVILLIGVLMGLSVPVASAANMIYCSNCGKQVTADSKFCWSCGSKINGSSGSSVDSAQTYTMVVYVTQEDADPHYRVFRDFSINKEYGRYGARMSYGEKCFTVTVTAKQLDAAKVYGPGEYILPAGSNYVNGYNGSSKNAYVMNVPLDNQDRCYPLFIKDENEAESTSIGSGSWTSYSGECRMTTGRNMPGTDCNYSVLDHKVANCTGITFTYQVTELWNGNCSGKRYLEICSDEYGWFVPDTRFDYSYRGQLVTVTVEWETPVTISAFGTARVYPDDSSFNFYHNLLSVRIA